MRLNALNAGQNFELTSQRRKRKDAPLFRAGGVDGLREADMEYARGWFAEEPERAGCDTKRKTVEFGEAGVADEQSEVGMVNQK
jgi:hypothetical protein